MTPAFPGFAAVECFTAVGSLLAWIPVLEFPVLRGVLIAVLGIGSWVIGLVVAYLLYRHYAAGVD